MKATRPTTVITGAKKSRNFANSREIQSNIDIIMFDHPIKHLSNTNTNPIAKNNTELHAKQSPIFLSDASAVILSITHFLLVLSRYASTSQSFQA
jgi:hypothetical protein